MDPGAAFRRDVSRETRARLERYEAILLHWQRRMNLISETSVGAVWTRHFLDSAQLAPLLPADADAHIVDAGSGAGFPGMVLGILERRRISLVEANAKRCAFLREVARATDAGVAVVRGRLEAPALRARLAPVDTVVARACAPLDALLGLVFHMLQPHTYCIFPKGRTYPMELEAAQRGWTFEVDILPSRTDPEARILRLRHVARR